MTTTQNLPISEKRCKGADGKLIPTLCQQRNQCRRHIQIELDRQLDLPIEAKVRLQTMNLPRVGKHECHFFLGTQ